MTYKMRLCLPLLLAANCTAAAPDANPTISLKPAPNSPLAINAYALAIADVNGDKYQDPIVTAEHLQVFLGDGSGRFGNVPDFDVDTKGHQTELAVADVNGDGKPDVIAADHNVYSVLVFLGDG